MMQESNKLPKTIEITVSSPEEEGVYVKLTFKISPDEASAVHRVVFCPELLEDSHNLIHRVAAKLITALKI